MRLLVQVESGSSDPPSNAGTIFVILEEDDLNAVMINGLLQSEDPRNKQPA